MIKKILHITISIIFSLSIASAQDFRYLTVENGLSSNITYLTIKDKKQITWIATRNGIDRFDGQNIKHYDLFTPSQQATSAIAMTFDKNGQLWAGTTQGLFSYDVSIDDFTIFSHKDFDYQNRINSLFVDEYNDLWIATNKGFFIFDIEKKIFKNIENPIGQAFVQLLHQDSKKNIWISSAKGNFIYKNNRFQRLEDIFTQIKTPIRDIIHTIFEDKNDRILLGTDANGLFVLNTKNQEFQQISASNASISEGAIRTINHWENNAFIIGIDGGGLLVMNNDLTIQKQFSYNEDQIGQLKDNGVYHIFLDEEQRYWIATYGGGINIYEPNSPKFRRIAHQINTPNSLNNNAVRAFIEDSKGNWWIGTEKGVSKYNPNQNVWKHFFNKKGQTNLLGSNTVLSLCEDDEGNIWIGTFAGGVTKLNPQTGQTTIYRTSESNESIGTNHVYKIYKDRKGQMWFGGIRGKLSKYLPATNTFEHINATMVYDMIEMSNGAFYLGTRTNGLFTLDTKTDKVTLVPFKDIEGAPMITCLYPQGQSLWMGTQGRGLLHFDAQTEKITQFSTQEGLPANIVVGILEDKNGRLWLSTARGLSCFDIKQGTFLNYDNQDGLGNLEFNLQAFGKTNKGQFLFGGQNGLTTFYPNDFHNNQTAIPKLFFTDFKLFNKSVKPSADAPIQQQLDDVQKIRLKHDQNAFSFDFVAINYGNAPKNKYKWRLKGFESNWSPSTNNASAIYTNIRHGQYTFEVIVSADGKNWSEPRSISIQIQPPFWQSSSAYLIYLVLILAIAALVSNYLSIRLKERNSEEKIKFFINIAHDLRTPLTLIKAPLEDLEKESFSDTAQEKLQLIKRNTNRLYQLMTQLLDFQKADLGKLQLLTREKNIIHYLKEKTMLFQPLAKEKHINLRFESTLQNLPLYYDTDKMDKIIYNLLSNAIKYTPENGTVTITAFEEKKYCLIQVKDTGIGIPLKQQKQIFKRYTRGKNAINQQITGSGVGLMLAYKLVHFQKGTIDFESIEGQGTVFNLRFPLGKEHLAPENILTTAIEQQPQKPALEQTLSLNEIENTSQQWTILVVEDNFDLRTYIANNLQQQYKVLQAENGETGLAIAKVETPDLIISDVMMPKMDGIKMCHQLKTSVETSHIPVILLTALNETGYKVKGIQSGADIYLEKPFEMKVLQAYIQNLIQLRQQLHLKYQSNTVETPQKEDFTNPIDHEFMKKVNQIIMEYLPDESFSVEVLCRKLLMSRPVLFRKIKALTGHSIQKYINTIRLNEAMKLIKARQHTVSEVAYLTGFSNPKYFSTSFKKFFGVSPSKVVS